MSFVNHLLRVVPFGEILVTPFYCFSSQINFLGLFACSGILFVGEASRLESRDSPLRPERFVTQKRPVRCGLRLGSRISWIWENIDLQRDWGWAEDYVVAMYLMLQQEQFSFREATPTDDYKGRDGGEL